MHYKIMGTTLLDGNSYCGNSDLKTIWKWLKMLGNNYNITKKWRKILRETMQMNKLSCMGSIKNDD